MSTSYRLDTRDKPGLLFAMMRAFASEKSRIALEGNLSHTELFALEGAFYDETETLKRATTAPQLEFVVLPLIPTRVIEIENAIRSKISFTGYRGIIHVQIENESEIVFGAYDNFEKESVVVSGTISMDVLNDLVKNGILRSYSRIG